MSFLDRITGLAGLTGEEVFLDKINRIKRLICMRICGKIWLQYRGEVLRACFEKFHESHPVNPKNPANPV
jgi:hypothetical protein